MGNYLLALVLVATCTACPFDYRPFRASVTPSAIEDSIPGQRCVFLVTVEERGTGLEGPVLVAAAAEGAEVFVENEEIWPGEVAEISVAPYELGADAKAGRDLSAAVMVTYGTCVQQMDLPIHITSEEEDLVGPLAEEVRDEFIPWLAANRPELGITGDTVWEGTIVTPHILIVTHYLFFSEEWEMHVFWHVMVPPHDWGRIELRRRFEETAPSLAFEIPSRSAAPPLEVVAIAPADTIWR